MKKIFIGVFVTVSLISCNNDDNIQPVITLNGANDMTTSLNETFVDPGATANDNVDGDLTANIVTTNNIDVNHVGNYHVYYNVEDSQGNNASQATRNVNVVNDADFLVGLYTVNVNASASCYFNSYSTNITASETVNNKIFADKFELNTIGGDTYIGYYSPSDDSLHFDASPSSNGYEGGYGKVTPTGFDLINFYADYAMTSDFNTYCAQVRNYIKQ